MGLAINSHQGLGITWLTNFPSFPSQYCTLKYILIAYTSTIVTLDWKHFVDLYELLVSYEEVETYAIDHSTAKPLHGNWPHKVC